VVTVDSADVQLEARALGDPTRYRLFRYIADADRPVGVGELTDLVRLNHNAVRQHLKVLREAGLVLEEVEQRDRPGRPRLLYRLHPEIAGSWGTPGAYEWLAQMLSRAIRDKMTPKEAGWREGRARAAALAGGGDPAELLEQEMVQRGFRPVRDGSGQRTVFVLGRCPFAAVAGQDPHTVCQLHLGLAEGLVDGLGGLAVERLVVKNPQRAGCRLVVRRVEAGRGAAHTGPVAGPARTRPRIGRSAPS